MGLLMLPFKLPLLPLRGVIWLGEVLRDEAERELHDPAEVRRELEEAEAKAREGELSEDEVSQVQEDAAARMVGPAATGDQAASGTPADNGAGR